MSEISLFDCTFKQWSKEQALGKIEELIRLGQRGHMCTVNIATLMMMRTNKRLKSVIEKAEMVVADGQPILWASRYLNNPLPERVTGIDLLGKIPELAQSNQWGIYLLGANQEVVTKVVEIYQQAYPKLIISGYRNGYFEKQEQDAIVEDINRSGAHILIVAMGIPRQDYFISDNWDTLHVNFAMGAGGSFDVISGLIKRAPVWMQKMGLEWLYRVLQEPRRLFMRYFITNTKFILIASKRVIYRALGIKYKQ